MFQIADCGCSLTNGKGLRDCLIEILTFACIFSSNNN